MELKLKAFEPGTYVELTDTVKGFRKIGRVAETGDLYFDLADPGATPLPIYEALDPQPVGDPLGWGLQLADRAPLEHQHYTALQQQLVEAKVDSLTLARALLWAARNRVYGFQQALKEGRSATAAVRDSRSTLDRIVGRAAAA